MPLYDFQHPLSGDVVEIFFHMDEENKSYTDNQGVEWNRIFCPVNLSATYRTFDEKRLLDKNGQPMRIRHLTDQFIRSQGFEKAEDYIEFSNSMVDPEKTPERNLQKIEEQKNDKEVQEKIKEFEARKKEGKKDPTPQQPQKKLPRPANMPSAKIGTKLDKSGKAKPFKVQK